ncbi:MAG: hypothetical protein ACRD6W_00285 [Nitrososphaerales archaeon]
MTRFELIADVSSEDLDGVRTVLEQMVRGTVNMASGGLHVEGMMEGEDARDVNRRLLSAMRRVEKRIRLRATWTAGGTSYRFFDYVPKGTTTAGSPE